MTPAQFAKAGATLYGPSWKRPLALALKVSEHSIYRWLAQRTAMPSNMPARLWALTMKREVEIASLKWRLNKLVYRRRSPVDFVFPLGTEFRVWYFGSQRGKHDKRIEEARRIAERPPGAERHSAQNSRSETN